MKLKRLLIILLVAVLIAGGVLAGVYYGTIAQNEIAPAYTRPANPVPVWDGPGAMPVEEAPEPTEPKPAQTVAPDKAP